MDSLLSVSTWEHAAEESYVRTHPETLTAGRIRLQLVSDVTVQDTHGNVVQSPLVVLLLKVRKGGGFFYGKSSNENHTQGV